MNSLQALSKRGLDITLSLLFLILPLSYAWFYIPWISVTLAHIFPQLGGFEKVKILFFLGFITLATLFFLGTRRLTKNHLILISLFFGWSIISYIVNQDINPYFWFGNMEKFHGWYLYLGLLMLGIILSTSERAEQKKYLTFSLISGGIVCFYALSQKLGLDPIQSLYSSRLDATRIFGTLWNPNYLAGYVLMLMPLSLLLTESRKTLWWCLVGFFSLILFWTKSLFGIGVFVWYVYYLLLYKYTPLEQKERHRITCTILWIIIVLWIYMAQRYGDQILEVQKIKGFIARYFLWETGIHTIFGDIRNTLFGYGPDGFLGVSELFRSPELAFYEDPSFKIDRSHNVWLDFFIHFGIPLGGYIIYWIFSQWKKLPLSHKETLVLFSIFFFFNIPIIVHYLLLVQILTMTDYRQLDSPKQHLH